MPVVQRCKASQAFDREVNHTGLAVLFRKAVYHTGSAVVVAVQQHQGMTQQ